MEMMSEAGMSLKREQGEKAFNHPILSIYLQTHTQESGQRSRNYLTANTKPNMETFYFKYDGLFV